MPGMNQTHGDLTAFRTQIDALDTHLVKLLNERAKVALAIGEIKAATGQKVYDPAREGDIIEQIAALNHGPLPKGAVEDIFRSIIDACRQIQITD
jgi:chorismate mutase/prephenate dehydratase